MPASFYTVPSVDVRKIVKLLDAVIIHSLSTNLGEIAAQVPFLPTVTLR